MKASVFLAVYDKNKDLPNVLTSLSRQKTSFPYEVCILDDCSPVDPTPLIQQYLPSARYKRLTKNIGSRQNGIELMQLASPDSDIIIHASSEIIFVQDDVIERMCQLVKPGVVVAAQVLDAPISPDMHKDFDQWQVNTLSNWDKIQQQNSVYSGTTRPGVWLFLSALTRDDFYKINWHNRKCDRVNHYVLDENNISLFHDDSIKSIHQRHPSYFHSCPELTTCPYVHRGQGTKFPKGCR